MTQEMAFLDMELYSVREAARLLTITPDKLRRWLDGGTVSGVFYRPVIRTERTGSDIVTWGEFVEAGLLREYRGRRVPLQRMRPFIDLLRRDLRKAGLEDRYPLAQLKPAVDVGQRDLVMRAQKEADLDEQLYLLRRVGPKDDTGAWQIQWADPVLRFLDKVEFHQGTAVRMFPLGKLKPVVIDPKVTFGIPQVRGIRTEILAEAYAEVGDEQRVANEWEIDVNDVRAALQWEVTTLRAA